MFENISADIKRLSDGRSSVRVLIRGLLSQGFQAILVYRFFRWLKTKNIPSQPLRFIFERFIEISAGISIPVECKIGKGLRIHHFGGIIFHPSVEIGENCTVYHEVTIGDKGGYGRAATIGDNVLIGAGAKIIGEIVIGNDCVIGANTVLTKDLPHNSVAIGNPSKIHKRKDTEHTVTKNKAPIHIMDFRGTYKGGGGPDKTILNSAALHDKKRVDIMVVYLRDPKDHEYSIDVWANSLEINYIDVPDRKLIDIACIKRLKRLIKKHNIELIHAHDDKTLLYGWLIKLSMPELHIIFTCHLHSPYTKKDFNSSGDYFKFKIRRSIQIFLMKRYQLPLLSVSDDTKRCLVSDGIPEKHIETLHNCIDINIWKADLSKPLLRKELNIKEGCFLVGTVARIAQRHKDLPTFYKVAAEVRKSVPKVTFVIVGDGHGDKLSDAKKEVARLGLSDVLCFTGHRTDLLDIYSSFDLFLMTSSTEGLPNTVLEAMAMQVPVVSTSVGGVPELVVHGETGFLSNKGDVKSLSEQVITLLKNDKLRKEFARNSRKRVEDRFSFSQRVKKMEDYYEMAVVR